MDDFVFSLTNPSSNVSPCDDFRIPWKSAKADITVNNPFLVYVIDSFRPVCPNVAFGQEKRRDSMSCIR